MVLPHHHGEHAAREADAPPHNQQSVTGLEAQADEDQPQQQQ